ADGRDVVLREEGPAGQAPAPDRHVGRGHPAHLGGPILVAEDDLDTEIDVRGDLRQEGNLLLNGVHVPQGQALGAMRTGPHPIHVAIAGFNPDEVLPQAADLLLNLPRRSLPHRDTTNEGPDTDTDP